MTVRSSALLHVVLTLGLMWNSAGSTSAQDRSRETRSVDSFTEVEFGVPGTLHVRQGADQSVEIEARQKVLDRLETTVDDGVLEIRSEGNRLTNWFSNSLDSDEMDVYVTAPTIHGLSVVGSGRIVGETPIEGETLTVSVAGSGDLEAEVDVNRLNIEVAGSGTSTLRGRAEAVNIDVAGSGDIRSSDLETRRAEIRIAGSGDVELRVTERLDATIMGSGDVRYAGSPEVELSSFGSGEVSPLN